MFIHNWIETRHFPIFVITLPHDVTRADIDGFYKEWIAWLEHNTHDYAVILDVTGVKSELRSIVRMAVAEGEKLTKKFEAAHNKAEARVATSASVRGALTALSWLDPSYPTKIFSAFDEAVAWAAGRLLAAGIQPPSRMPEKTSVARMVAHG